MTKNKHKPNKALELKRQAAEERLENIKAAEAKSKLEGLLALATIKSKYLRT